MNVLIVESSAEVSDKWIGPLRQRGWSVEVAATAAAAVACMDRRNFAVILLDLELENGNALSVPVYAGYRQPDARIVVVTGSAVFNDGSIFTLCANACAYMSAGADPQDIATLVDHHGQSAYGALTARARGAGAAH